MADKTYERDGIIATGPTRLKTLHGFNSAQAPVWILVFNSAAVPEDKTVAQIVCALNLGESSQQAVARLTREFPGAHP